jgi:hypothetical protein
VLVAQAAGRFDRAGGVDVLLLIACEPGELGLHVARLHAGLTEQ